MEDKVEKLIQRLEKELDNQNITVYKLAQMMGKPKITVYRWFRREAVMGMDNYYKALEVLGLKEKIS